MSASSAPRSVPPQPASGSLAEALTALVIARGARAPVLERHDGSTLGDRLVGGSLRVSFADGSVQDHALVASAKSLDAFARWMYAFPRETELPDAALRDALGETLNQSVGRIKERLLEAGDAEPLLGVPSLEHSQVSALIPLRPGYEQHRMRSEQWTGELLVVSTTRAALPLRLLASCHAVMTYGETRERFVRVQSLLAELEEAVSPPTATIRTVLGLCDRLVVQAIEGDTDLAPIVAQLGARFDQLRPELEATCDPTYYEFSAPQDPEELELLWEYLEDARTRVATAKAALGSDEDVEEALLGVFRCLHTLKGNAGCFGLLHVQHLAHATESLVCQLRSGTLAYDGITIGLCSGSIELIAEYHERLGEVLECGGTIPYQEPIGRQSRHLQAIVRGEHPPAPLEHAAQRETASDEEWFRLGAGDLERLEDVASRIGALTAGPGDSAAWDELADQQRQLAQILVRVRRVSIDRLLSKVARLCRETADSLHKVVRVETLAEGITVPKPLFTALSGPLVHLVRNAVDHGIEPVSERLAAGKPRMATVRCSAHWADGWLTVAISDDGRGLSIEKIRRRAVDKGLIDPHAPLETADLLGLVTLPGLSTATKVSETSGRGVGLDAVRSEVEAVGGRLEIESTPGRGCRFVLRVPESPTPGVADRGEDRPQSTDDEDEISVDNDGELNFL